MDMLNNIDMLRAKEAIFKLIAQFHHATKFDDSELYIYNYCESALEAAFNILGIEENYIKLIDFCKLWEDNSRSIWEIDHPEEPFDGITSEMHYDVFAEDYKNLQETIENEFRDVPCTNEDIYYINTDLNIVEHGIICSIVLKGSAIDELYIRFDDGEIESFDAKWLYDCLFINKLDAEKRLAERNKS